MAVTLLTSWNGQAAGSIYTGSDEASLIARGYASQGNLPVRTISQGQIANDDVYSALRGLSLFQQTGRKLLRSAQRKIAPIGNVMGTPPAITTGAGGAVSTLSGTAPTSPTYSAFATTRAWEDITGIGGAELASIDNSVSDLVALARKPGHASARRFVTDAPAFDISLQNNNAPFTVYVTDLTVGLSSRARVAANDLIVNNNTAYYHLFTFTDARPRLIEIYMGKTGAYAQGILRGINITPGYSIWKAPEPDQFNLIFLADSWSDLGGSTNTNPTKLLMTDYIAEQLGVQNALSVGLSGTGWVQNGGKATYGQRMTGFAAGNGGDIDPARIGNVDGIAAWDSINDFTAMGGDLAGWKAAKIAGLQLMRSKQPNALIFNWGLQWTPSSKAAGITQAYFDNCQDAFNTALGSDPGAIYIDNSPAGLNWLNDANNAIYFDAGDQSHMNNTGQANLGRRIGLEMARAVKAKYGF